MQPASRRHAFTFDEFRVRIREDQKAALIDGVIHLAFPENTEANRLFL